jgi:hypothetical protein
MALLASEVSNRHLELYDQINSRGHIKGVNLHTKLRLPALEIVLNSPINNLMVFNTLKSNVGLGKGEHTLYFRKGDDLVEIGKVDFSMRVIHTIFKIMKNYNPEIYGINNERGRFLLTDDDLVDTIELGI